MPKGKINGLTLAQAAEKYGLSFAGVRYRLARGIPLDAPKKSLPQNAARLYTVGDESLTVQQWAERCGAKPVTIYRRLRKGWSVEDAMTTRPRGRTNE